MHSLKGLLVPYLILSLVTCTGYQENMENKSNRTEFCTGGFDCILEIIESKKSFGFIDVNVAILAEHFLDKLMVVGDVSAHEYVVLVKSKQYCEFGDINGRTVCIPASGEFPLSRRIIRRFEEIITGERKNTYIEHIAYLSDYIKGSCKLHSWVLGDPISDGQIKEIYSNLLNLCHETQNGNRTSIPELECFENKGEVVLTMIETIVMTKLNASHWYLDPNGKSRKSMHIWFRIPKEVIITRDSSEVSTQTYLQNYMKNDINSPIKLLNRSQTLSAYIKSLNLSLDFVPGHKSIRWCTVSKKEQNKCLWLSRASYIEYTDVDIKCIQKPNIDDCLTSINRGEVDLVVCRKPHTRANANVTVIPIKEEDMTKILVIVDAIKYKTSTSFREKQGCVSKLADPDNILSSGIRDDNAKALQCLDLPDIEFAVIATNGTDTSLHTGSFKVVCKNHTLGANKVFDADCDCAFCKPRGSKLFIANNVLEDTKKLLLDLNVLFGPNSNHAFKLFGPFFNDDNLLFENSNNNLHFTYKMYNYSGNFERLLDCSNSDDSNECDAPRATGNIGPEVLVVIILVVLLVLAIITGLSYWKLRSSKPKNNMRTDGQGLDEIEQLPLHQRKNYEEEE